MYNVTEFDRILANSLYISTGIIGCLLNTTLFVVLLLNSTKGFYRSLTLVIALVDFCCAFSGIFQATWYYKIGNVLYCVVDYALKLYFPKKLMLPIWIVWVVTFYGELIVITYSFVWRAVLISNSRIVRVFEHKVVFLLLALLSCAIAFCDFSVACDVEYINLTPLQTLRILLSATLSGLNFILIATCALFISIRIKRGTLSRKMKNIHKKALFVLIMQAINPLFLNFVVVLVYELALIAPIPQFVVSFVPFSSLHPALNALIVLSLTSDHRRYLAKFFTQFTLITTTRSVSRSTP